MLNSELSKSAPADQDDYLLPDPDVRRRYGISDMTLWRWDRNAALNFPRPIRINGRKYRRLSELVRWERERAKQTVAA